MNAKFILMFILACNILSAIFGYGCAASGAACNAGGTGVINKFLIVDPANNFLAKGGVTVTEEMTTATTAQVTPFSGGTSSPTTGFTVFLDGLKMTLGMLTLLTPLPILDYIFSLGFPFYVNLILVPMFFVAYVIAMAEFIRGSQFGK